MAHLAALPFMEYAAGTVAPVLWGAAMGGALKAYAKRTMKRGIFDGQVISRKRKSNSEMVYSPKRLKFTPVTATPTRKSQYRNQLGRPIGTFGTRRTSREVEGVEFTDRAQSTHRLIYIPWSEDETQINKRRSNLVNVTGVRFRMQMIHKMGAGAYGLLNEAYESDERGRVIPCEFRWAIINPKQNTGAAINNFNEEFFITRNPTEQMSSNFTVNANYFTYHRQVINKEKYGVVKEGRFMLSPMMQQQENPAGVANTKSACAQLDIFIPLKKQMKFDLNDETGEAPFPENNLYFVMWYTGMNDLGTVKLFDGDDQKDIPFIWKWETTTYFRNAAMYR